MTINPGADVSVLNSDFYFNPLGQLHVEEGATVTFIQTDLTSCETTWSGINVHSDSSTPEFEGGLFLSNCELENAKIGIDTHDAGYLLTDALSYVGGAIGCSHPF